MRLRYANILCDFMLIYIMASAFVASLVYKFIVFVL